MPEQSVSFTSKGLKLSGIIRVPDGLKAGEKLIVGGIQKIRDGAPVAAAAPAAPARQGGGA